MSGEFLLYQAPDGSARIQVRLEDRTLWLTQQQLADLYQGTPQNITQHIRAIYAEGELTEAATCKPYLQVRAEAGRQVSRSLKHYNLDVIIAVGYRVRSHRGTQFRIWATTRSGVLVKGFALDDERLKRGRRRRTTSTSCSRASATSARRRRCSGARCSTSMRPASTTTHAPRHRSCFFATVQNKMHWAAHGHTAAELIADAGGCQGAEHGPDELAGLPRRRHPQGGRERSPRTTSMRRSWAALNRIVNAYIEIAELQAQARRAMTMRDWITRLDDFLRMTEREVLAHAGKVAAEVAQAKAEGEFAVYREQQLAAPSRAEQDFEAAISKPVKKIQMTRKPPRLPAKKKGEDV